MGKDVEYGREEAKEGRKEREMMCEPREGRMHEERTARGRHDWHRIRCLQGQQHMPRYVC
jgi:hypothetical protein